MEEQEQITYKLQVTVFFNVKDPMDVDAITDNLLGDYLMSFPQVSDLDYGASTSAGEGTMYSFPLITTFTDADEAEQWAQDELVPGVQDLAIPVSALHYAPGLNDPAPRVTSVTVSEATEA